MANLKRLARKKEDIRLDRDSKKYHGKVEVEEVHIPTAQKVEHRYYFVTNNGERFPINHYGPNKVIMQEGGLVQLALG